MNKKNLITKKESDYAKKRIRLPACDYKHILRFKVNARNLKFAFYDFGNAQNAIIINFTFPNSADLMNMVIINFTF